MMNSSTEFYKVTLACIAVSLAVTIVASSPAVRAPPAVGTSLETLNADNTNTLSAVTNPGQAEIDLDAEIPVDDNFHTIHNKGKREESELLQPDETFWPFSNGPDWGYYRQRYFPVWRQSAYRRWWPAGRTWF